MTENRSGGSGNRSDENFGSGDNGQKRSGHPFPNGFEGMNFEQIREPYRSNSSGHGGNGPADSEDTLNGRNEE